jgi:3'-phosphoadenosine 5'-phosphosulfate sulfotransferase (PAPS reductase)/FAD synthetase
MSRKEIVRLHARTSGFGRKVEQAREIIRQALETPNSPAYVALSGGKDSTVVYALAREQAPDIPAVWSDDEWWLPETMDYIRRLQAAGLDVRQIRTTAWHADWFTIRGDYDGIPAYAKEQNWGLVFLGLRQEESAARRVHLRTFGSLFFAQTDDFWHCNPIHDWSWRDVWAFIVSQELDYNQAYDRLEEIGVQPEHQRIGPFAVERALGYGQMAILKKGWPEMFIRFAEAHPEAREFV